MWWWPWHSDPTSPGFPWWEGGCRRPSGPHRPRRSTPSAAATLARTRPVTTADHRQKGQCGQILPLFALMLALLLLPVTALAVDGGLLLSAHANLVGTAQAAAEAGSQAIDVTALDLSGTFQLCGSPDGGPDCGNGVGD